MEQIITNEDREIYHQMLDKYLDETEAVKKESPRMIQFDKAEIDWDNKFASPGLKPKGNIKRTTYQMTIYIIKKITEK